MAGVGIVLRARGNAREELDKLYKRIDNRRDFYAAASEIMLDQTQMRFKGQRAPDGTPWRPLAPATVARRGSASPILEDSGALRGGLHAAPEAHRAVVRTGDLAYAAIHQAGGKAGRGRKVKIPARPYFGFGDTDIDEIVELAREMLGPARIR